MYLKSERDFNMNVGYYESSDESDESPPEELDPHLGNVVYMGHAMRKENLEFS